MNTLNSIASDDSNGTDSSTWEDTLIVNDVKFNNSPLKAEKKLERRLKKELKIKQEEEYNNEASEQRYKRLMHLLNKSKFYSSHLLNKIEDSKDKKVKQKRKRLVDDNNENIPPIKQPRIYIEKCNLPESSFTKITRKHAQQNQNTNKVEATLSMDKNIKSDPSINDTAIVPKFFCGKLYDYQQIGLQWLKRLYENGLNGILADEMGLGKTIQVIALICHLVEEKIKGPYLIIAPLSTIPNWLIEFEKFAPAIPTVLFHGTAYERKIVCQKIKHAHHVANNYETHPVVITSYEMPFYEKKFLQSQTWRYIVLDEGHRLKNYNCKLFKLLRNIRSINRLILTGTPLQNNLSELWSLLNFLLPEIFDELDTFETWFDIKEFQHSTEKLLKQEEEKHVLMSLREILKPFMLRRIKTDVNLNIPPKKELVVYAPLTELQHDLYKAVLNYNLEMLSKIEQSDVTIPTVNGERPKRRSFLKSKYGFVKNKSDSEMSDISQKDNNNEWEETIQPSDKNILSKWKKYTDVTERNKDFLICIQFQNRVPMYKKIVNHPYLVHCPLDPSGLPKIDDDFIKSSGKLLVLDAMLAKLKEQGHKILLFSTMTMILDRIEDYLSLRNYNYVRLDGQTNIELRQENIKAFNTDPNIFLFLISTRAGGVGLNLIGADTVIIYDSDWNPQVDIQAMARCHRIGQTKPVVVYRLCTRGTIDEIIIQRSQIKRILEKMVISKHVEHLVKDKKGLLELKKLMMSKDYKVVTSEKEVFTDMELNKLLDRSDIWTNNTYDAQDS